MRTAAESANLGDVSLPQAQNNTFALKDWTVDRAIR